MVSGLEDWQTFRTRTTKHSQIAKIRGGEEHDEASNILAVSWQLRRFVRLHQLRPNNSANEFRRYSNGVVSSQIKAVGFDADTPVKQRAAARTNELWCGRGDRASSPHTERRATNPKK